MHRFFGFTPLDRRVNYVGDTKDGFLISLSILNGIQGPSLLTGFT